MDRGAAISSLIAFDRPLAALRDALDALPLDGSAPVAVLRREDIGTILRRFLSGKITAAEVEAWACLVECRDDLEFEPRHEEEVADALYDLASPETSVEDIADELLERLS